MDLSCEISKIKVGNNYYFFKINGINIDQGKVSLMLNRYSLISKRNADEKQELIVVAFNIIFGFKRNLSLIISA